MPRRKRVAPIPPLLGSFWCGIQYTEVVLIDEHTENIGKGAAKKIKRLKNFDLALTAIAEDYFWGGINIQRKIKPLIDEPRKISALRDELQRRGLELEDRAMRSLAMDIKKQIRALATAKKIVEKEKGTS